MALVYTTVEAIERRLKGWATVNNVPDAFGTTQLDSALVEQLAEQAEARVDRCLRDRYQLPLSGSHADIAGIVEKLTLCQLIGQLYAGQQPSEGGGYGSLMCSQAERELKALKTMDLAGERALGAEVGQTVSGARSLPAIYKVAKSPERIKPVRW